MFDSAVAVTVEPQIVGDVVLGMLAGLVPIRLFAWGVDRARQIMGYM